MKLPGRHTLRLTAASAAIAAVLLCLSYLFNSLPYSFGGDVSAQVWTERIGFIFNGRSNHLPDSIALINVAYDKTLVDYDGRLYSTPGDNRRAPSGRIALTDRRKLLDFLKAAKGADYKYIMLDVRFDDDIESDSVSLALFGLIGSMERIAFAVHEGSDPVADAPLDKAAFGDYNITAFESNAVKYPIVHGGRPSMAAAMYSDLNGGRITTFGPLTFDRDALCLRSLFLDYPVRVFDRAVESDGLMPADYYYMNLGVDLLAGPDSVARIRDYVDGRIVVIGDFDNDVHDTSIGQLAGSLINLNAYISLSQGRHKISWLYVVMLFAIYSLIALCLIKRQSPVDMIPALRRRKSTALRFLFSLVGFSVVLSLLSLLLYLTAGIIYSIVLPSLYFSLISLWIEKRKLLSESPQ